MADEQQQQPQDGQQQHLTMQQKRMFRFLHTSMAIVSLIWVTICMMIYFHAPSYQTQQQLDCRWYLSALIVQVIFSHLFVFCSRTAWLYVTALIATQYAVVYSMLSLIIYGLDTVLLMAFPRATVYNYVPYLKLTAVLIVLSGFGLALSLVHAYRLIQLARELAINVSPSAITNANEVATTTQPSLITTSIPTPQSTTSNETMIPLGSKMRTLRAITGGQAILSLLSIYVVVSLLPIKYWYVRAHLVQEFSCSLLATSLALMQFAVFRTINCSSLLVKAIVFSNACQLIQELNMSLSAFYTYFYLGEISDLVEHSEQALTGSVPDAHIQLAISRIHHAQSVLVLNLLLHIGRMLFNAYIIYSLATQAYSQALSLRIKFKLDSEIVNADENWARMAKKETNWLHAIGCCVLAIGVAHVLLNAAYVWASMIFESLTVATGLSFVFSMALLVAIGLYTYKLSRFYLILTAYFSLNLLVTAALLLFSFIQDFFFLASTLDQGNEHEVIPSANSTTMSPKFALTNATSSEQQEEEEEDSALRVPLYFADFGLALGTFLVAAFTIRYAFRTLIKTKVLQTQPKNVQRIIRMLRTVAMIGIVTATIEFFMLAEFRLEGRNKVTTHNSINSSFYDWLLSFSQFILLLYVTRHERFQALLAVQLLQLASVSITTLDLIGQQTETVQIYVNNVLQFYRVTEALLHQTMDMAMGSASGSASAPSNAIFITQSASYTVPMHLFVDILALHFLQIIQWFLTIAALAMSIYAFDNMVEDESDRTNDFHELRNNNNNNAGLVIGWRRNSAANAFDSPVNSASAQQQEQTSNGIDNSAVQSPELTNTKTRNANENAKLQGAMYNTTNNNSRAATAFDNILFFEQPTTQHE